MVAPDNILGESNVTFFDKFWSRQKNLSTRLFVPFLKNQVTEILLNNLLQTLCILIIRRTTKGGEFCNKYLGWGCVSKWDQVGFKNISSAYNTKLSALAFLSITGAESL